MAHQPKPLTIFRIAFLYSALSWGLAIDAQTTKGFLEGQLKIISIKEVELAQTGPSKPSAGNYADYPLVVLNKTTRQQVGRVVPDQKGEYRLELPLGDYILDIDRHRGGIARIQPQPFTISPNQTVRVNMQVDTGVR